MFPAGTGSGAAEPCSCYLFGLLAVGVGCGAVPARDFGSWDAAGSAGRRGGGGVRRAQEPPFARMSIPAQHPPYPKCTSPDPNPAHYRRRPSKYPSGSPAASVSSLEPQMHQSDLAANLASSFRG